MSRLGQDVNKRLEQHLNVVARPLPDTAAVHPWHPTGFDRGVLSNRKPLHLQAKVIDYSAERGISDWTNRTEYTERVYENNSRFVDRMLAKPGLARPGSTEVDEPSKLDRVWGSISNRLANVLYE